MRADLEETKTGPVAMDGEKPSQQDAPGAPSSTPSMPSGRERREENSKQRLHKFEHKVRKFTEPIDRLSVSTGCESFLPQPMGDECRKAARIITSLSAYVPPRNVTGDSYEMYPPQRPFVTIPPSAIANAQGILTLTTLRLGFGRVAVSTGSGILIARRQDGNWGLPAGVRVHSVGGGPIALGVGITDRVYIINDRKTLEELAGVRRRHEGVGRDATVAAKPAQKKCCIFDAEGVVALGGFGGGGGLTFVIPPNNKKEKREERRRQRGGWSWWWWGRAAEEKDHKDDGEGGVMTRSTTGHSNTCMEEKLVAPADSHDCAECGQPKNKGKHDKMKGVKDSLQRPIYCYSRCRGLYAGFQAQGAAMLHRDEANAAFYGGGVDGGVATHQLILGDGDGRPEDGPWRQQVDVLVAALERASRSPPAEDKTVPTGSEENVENGS